MKNHYTYLKYVLKHKYFVYKACRKLNLGYWQSLIHDASKFRSSEWTPYVNTFYNKDGSKKPYAQSNEFAKAWNLHQKRNKHHWQHWLLTWDNGKVEALVMPYKYIKEMVADWVGAGLAITGKLEVGEWYEKNKDKIVLEPTSRNFAEHLIKTHFTNISKL